MRYLAKKQTQKINPLVKRKAQSKRPSEKLSPKALEMRAAETRKWRKEYHPAHLERQRIMGVDYELGLPVAGRVGAPR